MSVFLFAVAVGEPDDNTFVGASGSKALAVLGKGKAVDRAGVCTERADKGEVGRLVKQHAVAHCHDEGVAVYG